MMNKMHKNSYNNHVIKTTLMKSVKLFRVSSLYIICNRSTGALIGSALALSNKTPLDKPGAQVKKSKHKTKYLRLLFYYIKFTRKIS